MTRAVAAGKTHSGWHMAMQEGVVRLPSIAHDRAAFPMEDAEGES